jgi:hypothetical protein
LAMGEWMGLYYEVYKEQKQPLHIWIHLFHIFIPNTQYFYRICGVNGVGFGACSDQATPVTPTYPIQMSPLVNISI